MKFSALLCSALLVPWAAPASASGTGDPIVVGGFYNAEFYPGMDDGFAARVERANRDDEVGRPIEYVGVRDDQLDSNQSLAITRELIAQEGVDVLAPVVSNGLQAPVMQVASDAHAPVFGWGATSEVYCVETTTFSISGCGVGPNGNRGLVEPLATLLGEDPSEISIAMSFHDDATGHQSLEMASMTAERLGFDVVYAEAEVPFGDVTDFAPYVERIMAADPDVVQTYHGFNQSVGFVGALKAAGFEGVLQSFVAYAPALLPQQPDLAAAIDGTYVNVGVPPAEEGGEAIEQIQADLAAIDRPTDVSQGVALGYWIADLMVAALAEAGPDATGADIGALGESFRWDASASGGLNVEYPANRETSPGCTGVVEAVETSYEVVVPFECYGYELID